MAKRKPGKYDHILAKLKPLPPQNMAVQEKIDSIKQQLRGEHQPIDATKLSLLYVEARATVEELAQLTSHANLELEAVVQLLIATHDKQHPDPVWGQFGASDNSMKLLNGDTIRLQGEIYPVPKDKSLFREWCFANGLRQRMELPVKPMTDLVKQKLLNGEAEPKGIETYVRTKVVYTPLKTEVTEQQQSDEHVEEMTF